jgi:hypothetical protein
VNIKARDQYRSSIRTLLDLGGLSDRIPQTEREWVLFNTNQHLRDIGIGKPLPWAERPSTDIRTPEDLLAALEEAARPAVKYVQEVARA